MFELKHYIYFAACLLSCVQMAVYSRYKLRTKGTAYTVSKCAGSVLFFLVSLLPVFFGCADTYCTLIIIAMALSCIGDYYLSLPHGHHRLKLGAASFACAHIFFAAAFISVAGLNLYAIAGGIVFYLVELLAARIIKLNFRGAGKLVAVYIFFITTMATLACSCLLTGAITGTAGIMTAIGGVLFLISDVFWMLYGLDKDSPRDVFKVINVLTYFPAQMLIAGALVFR